MLQQVCTLSFKWLQGAEYLDKLTLRFPTQLENAYLAHSNIEVQSHSLLGCDSVV
jgi:hypothetical protein